MGQRLAITMLSKRGRRPRGMVSLRSRGPWLNVTQSHTALGYVTGNALGRHSRVQCTMVRLQPPPLKLSSLVEFAPSPNYHSNLE
jgi:hypothetical protein